MKHYAGLDVSVKETCVCIVDGTGTVCREIKVPSHPQDLLRILQDPTWRLERIGLEAGPLSQWLFEGLADAGLPVVCIETRHTKAFLKGVGPVVALAFVATLDSPARFRTSKAVGPALGLTPVQHQRAKVTGSDGSRSAAMPCCEPCWSKPLNRCSCA